MKKQTVNLVGKKVNKSYYALFKNVRTYKKEKFSDFD